VTVFYLTTSPLPGPSYTTSMDATSRWSTRPRPLRWGQVNDPRYDELWPSSGLNDFHRGGFLSAHPCK
jgi:hypothetical protein